MSTRIQSEAYQGIKKDFPLVDTEIIEKYTNFSKDDDRLHYIAVDVNPNAETLQFLLNEEQDDELADLLEQMIERLKEIDEY